MKPPGGSNPYRQNLLHSTIAGNNNSLSNPDHNNSNNIERNNRKSHHHHIRSKSIVYEKEKEIFSDESDFSNVYHNIQNNHSCFNELLDNNHIRPTSLYTDKTRNCLLLVQDGFQPEREPIQFDVTLIGAPPEVEQLVNNIKQVAEQFLYHWKTFPIVLPTSMCYYDSIQTSQSLGSLGRIKTKFHLRDLFIAPSFDELDAVAVDSKGETRRLTGKQLEYIREKGEFDVDSLNFPGQQHRWKLSQLLQKGVINSRNSLLNDLSLALRFLFITARGRLISHFFSITEALKSLIAGLLRILDILIGIPSLQAHNLDMKIREERTKYLVAELVCRPENEESLEHLCSFIRKQLRRATTEKFDIEKECSQLPVAAVPYKFLTPAGTELDLRLWDRNIIRKALPILVSILERETRGWFLHFREKLIAELRSNKMSDKDIEKEVNEAVMREYLQRVYNNILTNSDIIKLGDGIAQLLINQAQSVVLMYRAVENVQYRLKKSQEEYKNYLENNYPVLSRIKPWLRLKLRKAEEKFSCDNLWSTHEEALTLCNSQKLYQTVYFLNRDLAFMKEREPALLRELKKVKSPTRTFFWPIQIWLPKNWIIRRNFQGQSEIIPTILSKQATSITTPRSDPSQPVFLVEKEIVHSTTTRWPLWRIFNYFHRTWCWTWNAIFFFGIVLPWCSPIGLRALFYLEPFMPDLELSQINGTLFPRKTSVTPTLCSRLINLWRHISKSRTHFETKPDTGFIGKGFTRHLNRLWNYFIKGLFGTILIVIIFPIVSLTIIIFSLFVAFTAIIWMPLLTLIVQLTNAFIYDIDCPEKKRNRFFVLFEALFWKIILQGCAQPLIASFVAVFICPMISLIILIGGVIRYWFRLLWDTTIFHLIIKKRGRIPASDSFVVKRIAGPGLASDYYFQISPEQALAAFEAKMEWDELIVYQTIMENIITQPQRDFGQFVEACFGNFSAQLAKNGSYKNLEKEAYDLLGLLHEKLEKKRRDLQTGLSVTVKSKIKLETSELKIAIQQGALMLERFYPKNILPKLDCSEEQFWENRGLSQGDWPGLTGILYTELFSLDFLTPLDHLDTSFRLDPHPQADLSRYTEMIQNAQLGVNGPDLLGNVYMPRGNIQVHSPYLEVSAFNPRTKIQTICRKNVHNKSTPGRNISLDCLDNNPTLKRKTSRTLQINYNCLMPWKRPYKNFTSDKIIIPLSIPHPCQIAVTIFNRDSDDPIPLESEVCQIILKAIEENQNILLFNDTTVGRYKGGCGDDGDDETSASISSNNSSSNGNRTYYTNTDGRNEINTTSGVYQWTLNNWGQRKRKNSGSVRVDLASPEDVTLDSDSTRVVFSNYGTTV